jgi:hypothetical protein
VISRVCLYESEEDFWFVFGELTNQTGSLLSFVEVVVTFLDPNGSLLGEDFNEITVEAMPHGATLPFAIQLDSLGPPAQYRFQVFAEPADVTPRTDLQVSNLQLAPGNNRLLLTGNITNPGEALSDFAEVIATFYNADGAVVAVGYRAIDSLQLGAAQTARFEIIVSGLTELVTDHYTVVAYGY